jgi:hypothetical protein
LQKKVTDSRELLSSFDEHPPYCNQFGNSYDSDIHVHVQVIYFSVNLLQDMEIVILITIKRIQQHRIHTHTHTQN